MKKLVVSLVGLMIGFAGYVVAAEQHSSSDFCFKHCTSIQLKKEISELEKAIQQAKATIANPGSGDKIAVLSARREKAKKHLVQHESELAALKEKVNVLETELAEMEKK